MTTHSLVSVIMPLYNKRPYVKRAIDSVIQQTLTDWELIIVDDGSTDGSLDEIPSVEQRIRIFQQTNAGPGTARNHGIRMARGEFVTFLDADDYYYPQKLKQEMKLLHKGKKAEWMVSAFEYEENNRVRLRNICDIEGKEITGQPSVFDNAIVQLKIQGWPSDGLCIKKALLDLLGGFREGMRCFEITDLLVRCALVQPKVLICPIPLFRVIDVPQSAFKVSSHRIEGTRQMGEGLYNLAIYYPESSHILTPRSREHLFSYVTALIRSDRNNEARKYLNNKFPYSRDKIWWKLWILSWIPQWLLKCGKWIRKNWF